MEVSQSEQARIGDVFDFFYTIRGIGKQGQINGLVSELDKDTRWKVLEYDLQDNRLRLRLKVLQNPFPIVLVVAAIGAIGTGLFVFLSLDKVEKVVASPAGALTMVGTVGVGVLILLRGFRSG